MIERKKRICVDCKKEKYIFSKGRCQFCASKSYKKPKKITEKTLAKNKLRSEIRNEYFDYHVPKCKKSEESGTLINNSSRWNICHILPKSSHKSVQAHLDNYVYLTKTEHELLDNYLFTLQFERIKEELPNTWILICERLKIVLPVCEEKTKMYLKFKDYLNI